MPDTSSTCSSGREDMGSKCAVLDWRHLQAHMLNLNPEPYRTPKAVPHDRQSKLTSPPDTGILLCSSSSSSRGSSRAVSACGGQAGLLSIRSHAVGRQDPASGL